MIKIRDESDFQNWFKKNYKKLGFTKILRHDSGDFPDFVVLEKGKKVRIELEMKSSNFILHKHPISKVDKVICIKKDVDLEIPVIELTNFERIKFDKQTPYSIANQVYQLFDKERVLTTIEASKKLKISWNTAEKAFLELTPDGKVQRIKKSGVNLWMLKK